MLFKELYINNKGVFESVFKTEFPYEYKEIFGDLDPKEIDTYALLNYGEKKLYSVITKSNYKVILQSVMYLNIYSWVKQAEILSSEYDALKPLIREIKDNRADTRDETKTNDTTNSKKYFNDGEFTDGQKEVAETKQGWAETQERAYSESGIGNNNAVSEIIQKEVKLRELNIIKKVTNELVAEITLKLY